MSICVRFDGSDLWFAGGAQVQQCFENSVTIFPIHETKCNIFSSKLNQRENQIRTIEIASKRARKREFHLQSSAMWSFGQKHQREEKQIYEFSCCFFFGYCCCLIHLLAVFALNKWVGLCCCVEQSVHIKSSEEETKKEKKRRAN